MLELARISTALISASLVVASLVVATQGASAADSRPVDAGVRDEGDATAPSVDEVMVIGSRRLSDAQAASQAISAFDMQSLDRANIVQVDQLAFNVPALHVGQLGSQSIITLRGIGTENAGITATNGQSLARFRDEVTRQWHRALRRRSQRDRTNWQRMRRLVDHWIPPVRIRHAWPDERFDVRTRGRSPVR